jgi:hypothetical protein
LLLGRMGVAFMESLFSLLILFIIFDVWKTLIFVLITIYLIWHFPISFQHNVFNTECFKILWSVVGGLTKLWSYFSIKSHSTSMHFAHLCSSLFNPSK